MDGRPWPSLEQHNCSRSQVYLKVLPDVDRRGRESPGLSCPLLLPRTAGQWRSTPGARACSAAGQDGVRNASSPASARGSWSWVS